MDPGSTARGGTRLLIGCRRRLDIESHVLIGRGAGRGGEAVAMATAPSPQCPRGRYRRRGRAGPAGAEGRLRPRCPRGSPSAVRPLPGSLGSLPATESSAGRGRLRAAAPRHTVGARSGGSRGAGVRRGWREPLGPPAWGGCGAAGRGAPTRDPGTGERGTARPGSSGASRARGRPGRSGSRSAETARAPLSPAAGGGEQRGSGGYGE